MLGLDDHVAQPRPRRDDDLRRAVPLLASLGEQRLVGLEPRLGLRLARARRHAHPFELVLERPLARGFLLLLLGQALLLLVEPGGVVALPRDARAAVELEDPAGDVVEEVAVVGDGHDRAGIVLEEALEPRDALRVEVVGRLVEQQQVGLLEEQAAERHAPDLAARERRDVGVAGRAAERVHRDLDRAVEVPAVRGLDRVLHARLLLEDLLHLRGVHGLAQLRVDLVEAREEPTHLGHAVLHVRRGHPSPGRGAAPEAGSRCARRRPAWPRRGSPGPPPP